MVPTNQDDAGLSLADAASLGRIVERFEEAWQRGQRPDLDAYLPAGGALRRAALVNLIHVDLEGRLNTGEATRVEAYLQRYPELRADPTAVAGLAAAEYELRRSRDPQVAPDEYFRRFPDYGEHLRVGLGIVPFQTMQTIGGVLQPRGPAVSAAAAVFDEKAAAGVLCANESALAVQTVSTAPAREPAGEQAMPARLGRYQITETLGKGGFGVVYKGYDDQLRRHVAIKVPHPKRVSRPADIEDFLAEARILASLDHPHIVPVHDVGRTDDGLCYVVSKFVEGSDLAKRTRTTRPAFAESAELVAAVAEALHHAHRRGLVHRDIKPANILLDSTGRPYVTDFGLALKEENFGTGAGIAGTPAYMSPEQARGEGHRVDGRSDIFSLGVVLYQLLAGRLPFRGDTASAVLEQITGIEPRPPRQIEDTIPKELERICLKALAKRPSERYTTAKDLADDLRHFLGSPQGQSAKLPGFLVDDLSTLTPPAAVASSQPPAKIVPKGLRSFDAKDADFFLELLPGPRDRDGLPESIRFWKNRIEETDGDKTFPVGLLYGPSGCGKSSLMRAGLLPRLANHVTVIYVESAAGETEERLRAGLRKHCPRLPDNGLAALFAALRRGQGAPPQTKVLIVLDQFEQWLHAKHGAHSAELVQALRQCDGGRLQALVMVRDDFWLAISRFMKALEIRVVEGQNSALVDLFDPLHARKVLAEFGRSFGRLPEKLGNLTKDQESFLQQAVTDLSQDGKVISVRLALFAEMVKGKDWTPATLKAMGGAAGVGVAFLEETFSASTAPPEHRLHQKAARSVLKMLLPGKGADIKGQLRSRHELQAASGYVGPAADTDFEDLLQILDGELRLITPTDPEGVDPEGQSAKAVGSYYQLTHDYLVPALRDWLTRKQRETRLGRAELRLAEWAAAWNSRPERRNLPAWWEWANIRLFTSKTHWSDPQRRMMRTASRYHIARGLSVVGLLVVATFLVLAIRDRVATQEKTTHAAGLVQRLLDAETGQTATIIAEMAPYRPWTDPLLRKAIETAAPGSRQKLHAGLALLPVDPGQVDYLYERLLEAQPHEVSLIRDALAPHKQELLDKLWNLLEQSGKAKEAQRLRAAFALASYQPDSPNWQQASAAVVDQLVAENPVYLGSWIDGFRPVKEKLLVPLAAVFRDRAAARTAERSLAMNILADYADGLPMVLADLLMDADEKQFAALYPKLTEHQEAGIKPLLAELDKRAQGNAEKLAKRQATAAVALLRMGQATPVWPLLKHTPDPRVRSYLIHQLGPMGASPGALITRLKDELDVTIRRALLLSLGEFADKELPPAEREALLPELLAFYRDGPDAGLHGAAEWLLRQWQQDDALKKIDIELATSKVEGKRHWYINSQEQTLVVVRGPVDFVMGAPAKEAGDRPDEHLQHRRIGRTFAIAAKSVTLEQFFRFRGKYDYDPRYAPSPDCPAHGINFYMAAEYCNWLSQREGLPEQEWCYEPNKDGKFAEGMTLAPGYLKRTGYRLPTEAEWEYACRSGTVTSRYYGEAEELFGKYAWFLENARDRSWPVGRLKPNDLGLFDMHGNVWNWCLDRHKSNSTDHDPGQILEDGEDSLVINPQEPRVWRGGSFALQSVSVGSGARARRAPWYRTTFAGFRPARTLPSTR